MAENGGHRRIDRVLEPSFVEGLGGLELTALRARRDECLAEREYLSLLRRLVQGRAEILKAELESRGTDGDATPLVDRLSSILGGEEQHQGPARGEAVRVGVPEEEMLLARRRVERLVSDAGISDPGALDDDQLAKVVEVLSTEEGDVSAARGQVLRVLDTLQEELKRRYREDPTLALR